MSRDDRNVFARLRDDAADLLQQTLDDEKAADEKLSSLAEDGINQKAADTVHSADNEEEMPKMPPPRSRARATAAKRSSSR